MHYRSSLARAVVALLAFSFSVVAAPSDPDASFGVRGIARAAVSRKSNDVGTAIARQADGKLVVAGISELESSITTETTIIIVSRWNTNGTPDTTFGQQGRTTIRIKTQARATAVAILSDGNILVGGHVNFYQGDANPPAASQRAFLVARLLPNGVLDIAFGVGGRQLYYPDATRNNTLSDLIALPDGKFIAAGYSGTAPSFVNANLIVARYNADGSPDATFDGDGVALFSVAGAGPARANSLALQQDGKIVVGGTLRETAGGTSDFLFARFNPNGTLDGTFDGDGWKALRFTGAGSTITRIAIQPDGKIVAAGNRDVPFTAPRDILLARLESNGTPDSAFDSDGMLTTNVDGDDTANGLAIQTDGKIVVSGFSIPTAAPGDFVVVRYNTDGTLDNSFDGDGKVITSVTSVIDRPNAMLIDPEGRIVATGFAGTPATVFEKDLAIVRYNPNGSLDSTFDNDGMVVAELANGGDGIEEFVQLPDGKIIAGGYAYVGAYAQPALAKFNANGTLDTSFGDQGKVVFETEFGFEERFITALARQADGKIVFIIGSFLLEKGRYVVARVNTNGTLDNTFGTGGMVTVQVGSFRDEPSSIAVQSDGKIVVAGHSDGLPSLPNGRGPSMIRLDSAGVLDPTFGTGGKYTLDAMTEFIWNVDIQSDGKIVLSGNDSSGPVSDILVRRFTSTAVPDTSFNGTGRATASVGTFDVGNDALIQPDGKIVVSSYTDKNAGVVRFNANGTLDNTFDGDGKLFIPRDNDLFFDFELRSVAYQADGRLVLAGRVVAPGMAYAGVIFRLKADGSFDSSFGPGGRLLFPLGDFDSAFTHVMVQPDGRIVAGGVSSNGVNDDFTLMRLRGAAGTTPFDFDGDGKTDISIFRPSDGTWWINRSSTGATTAAAFGNSADRAVPADFTGDGKTDIAFWRPSTGDWYVLRSEDGSFYAFPFGTAGDIPVPADYDNDGKADVAVFRPSFGTWYILRSSEGGTTIQQFGQNGDRPVSADYDGDGKADQAIFRPADGTWWLNRSTAGVIAIAFGTATDKQVPGDFTGDGKADVAFWRPSTGDWGVVRSEDLSFYGFPFGTNGDIAAPGDYDGDGKLDATVFRPSQSTWYSFRSTAGTLIQQFGADGDRPVPNAFVP